MCISAYMDRMVCNAGKQEINTKHELMDIEQAVFWTYPDLPMSIFHVMFAIFFITIPWVGSYPIH